MTNTLVAIDFSDSTQLLFDEAVKWGQLLNSKVHFVHVEDEDPAFVGYGVGPQSVRDAVSEELHHAHAALLELCEKAVQLGLDAQPHFCRGPIVESILKQAERVSADLIILGSHGHGALYSQIVGSVSEGVLRSLRYPVLVIPVRQ